MSEKSRTSSDIVNTMPLVYTDENISEQENRQRIGDIWLHGQTDSNRSITPPQFKKHLRITNKGTFHNKKPLARLRRKR